MRKVVAIKSTTLDGFADSHEGLGFEWTARDQPCGLWVLADGRYALTGPLAATGSRGDLTEWARRRMRKVGPDERAWLQNVVGALAADPEGPLQGPASDVGLHLAKNPNRPPGGRP